MRPPNWLDKAEKKIGFIALPNLYLYVLVLQIFGFLTLNLNPNAFSRLILIPEAVLQGEIWRLLTFTAIPLSGGIFMLFVLWFLYFILKILEQEWGEFKLTFYLASTILLTIAYSFLFNYPVVTFRHIEITLFLAAALLFPDEEIMLFMIIPVKMIYMAILPAIFIVWDFYSGSWLDRGYLVVVFTMFFIFFYPSFIEKVKGYYRRQKNKNIFRR